MARSVGSTFWKKVAALAKRRPRVFFSSLALVIVLMAFPTLLGQGVGLDRSAEYYFIPPPQEYVAGEDFDFEVRIKTGGAEVNAMGLHIKYNPIYLQVLNVTTDKSFCVFYTENSFNNTAGLIRISCGAPSPGFRGDSVAVRIKARATIPGRAEIRVDDQASQILANDGKGSNIMKSVPLPLIITTKQL